MMPRGFGSMTAMLLTASLSNKVDDRILDNYRFKPSWRSKLDVRLIEPANIKHEHCDTKLYKGIGMGLSMVPIMNLSVETLKNSQMTNATGIQNLLKNIGSAIGTSLVATMLTRFAQIHQYMLVGKMHELNPAFIERVQSTAGALVQYTEMTVAQYMAQYSMYGQLVKQSTLWAFIDSFRIFGLLCFVTIPLLFLIKKTKKSI